MTAGTAVEVETRTDAVGDSFGLFEFHFPGGEIVALATGQARKRTSGSGSAPTNAGILRGCRRCAGNEWRDLRVDQQQRRDARRDGERQRRLPGSFDDA